MSGIALLGIDVLGRAMTSIHAHASAAPLVLIGAAYVCLQPAVRPHAMELVKRLLLGFAFLLWGYVQLLPPGTIATILGDIVIALYVVDLYLIIRTHLRRDDWDTP
jgi:hypothetical protein